MRLSSRPRIRRTPLHPVDCQLEYNGVHAIGIATSYTFLRIGFDASRHALPLSLKSRCAMQN